MGKTNSPNISYELLNLSTIRFTPTERRLVTLLADGKPHTKNELHTKLDDELSEFAALHKHFRLIRKKLPAGFEIICQVVHRRFCYRLVVNAYHFVVT